MSQLVTISSVTANTPVNIYYCDSTGASCVYVATVSTFPYTFDVPDPYKRPKAIFFGVEGSIPLRFKKPKKARTRGVSAITQKGFTD